MFCLGLAYRGTANNNAIARLLHCAVTDVSDDVRRAAVTSLGFVLMGNPEQVRGAEIPTLEGGHGRDVSGVAGGAPYPPDDQAQRGCHTKRRGRRHCRAC
jgi:hypothetical protein